MKNIIYKIFDSNLFHKRFDGLRWYGNILYRTKRINIWLHLYSCDINKNIECKKNNCDKDFCSKTTKYKYAKKTPLNFVKKIINKIRGAYKYG